MPKISSKYAALLTALIMSLMMGFLMSGLVTFFNKGLVDGFVSIWLHAFVKVWPIAFVLLFLLRPLVVKIVALLVDSSSSNLNAQHVLKDD